MITVFVQARNAEMNTNVSVLDGHIVRAFPNYVQVYREPPTPSAEDVFVYALEVDENLVHDVPENGPGVPKVTRLWDGPRESRSFGSLRVLCRIRSMRQESNLSMTDADIARLKAENAKNAETIQMLHEELTKAKSAQSTDLKTAIRAATDEEIIAIPHIGKLQVATVRKWAEI